MGLSDIISGVFKPVTELIGKAIPDADKKMEVTQALIVIQADMAAKALEYEKTLATEQGATIRAEAQSQSWLARNWRPLLMLFFGVVIGWVIFHGAYDLAGRPIPENFVTYVLKIVEFGVGGYVVGRSAEKIIPAAVGALKK